MATARGKLNAIYNAQNGGNPFTSAEQTTALADIAAAKASAAVAETNSTTQLTGVGSVFWVKKTLTSSAILASAAVDLTGVSSGGELELEEVTLMTNSTGLATGTNVNILVNNTKGLLTIAAEAVANLGANKTVNMTDATVTDMARTFIESGKKVQIQSTDLDCDGAGTVDVRLRFRRLTAGATIAAAA